MEKIADIIQKNTGITFTNIEILQTAFCHTSYANEHAKEKLKDNERLEFLGDAVLELITSDFLFNTYPDKPEGQLTRMRAQLVKEPSLALVARKYQLDQLIQLGKGEEASGGRFRDSIVSDAFEAFLGAIYLDQGFARVTEFLQQALLKPHLQIIKVINIDYKTLFQEKVQSQGPVNIDYRLIKEEGPAHHRLFVVALYLDDQLVSQGQGYSKKSAQMAAAEAALEAMDEKGKL
ncbi:ribonuclease III [Eremococcus coleocola]|uniref:Ribonuclease 3 n=1 Tax=Eremococcus coleocola ACS-139-V-Col8 TaxID=908337 RepID=E4KNW1_9LACT|nr:ribonuclease III [Eremococcus coleocola]EFR31049.1 ribonuclease III [Eremococcus coleocola ACS-139-V-Col8]